MSATIESFFPYLMPLVPGCPDTLAIQALRETAIDFCTQTDLIQSIQSINVVANTADVAVVVPADMSLARILSVSWQNRTLYVASPSQISDGVLLTGVAIGTADITKGTPQYYFTKNPSSSTITLYPTPDASLTNGLTVKASWIPSKTCMSLDQILFDDWSTALAAGAAASLMVMPGQPFSSPLAKGYADDYRTSVARAYRQANIGLQRTAMFAQPRSFV